MDTDRLGNLLVFHRRNLSSVDPEVSKVEKRKILEWVPVDPRIFYWESRQVYSQPLHALIAAFGLPLAAVLMVWTHWNLAGMIVSDSGQDYTMLGVWLIVVPVSLMVLVNYHLVMKRELKRKRMSYE